TPDRAPTAARATPPRPAPTSRASPPGTPARSDHAPSASASQHLPWSRHITASRARIARPRVTRSAVAALVDDPLAVAHPADVRPLSHVFPGQGARFGVVLELLHGRRDPVVSVPPLQLRRHLPSPRRHHRHELIRPQVHNPVINPLLSRLRTTFERLPTHLVTGHLVTHPVQEPLVAQLHPVLQLLHGNLQLLTLLTTHCYFSHLLNGHLPTRHNHLLHSPTNHPTQLHLPNPTHHITHHSPPPTSFQPNHPPNCPPTSQNPKGNPARTKCVWGF